MKKEFIKIACINPYVYVGNPHENAKEIVRLLNESKASINLFPELSISGYSCRDLFKSIVLLDEAKEGLKYILDNVNTASIYVVGMPLSIDGGLYNCAVVVKGKKILGVVPKMNLAFTHNQNEHYWFKPGKDLNIDSIKLFDEEVPFGNIVFSSKAYSFGVEICEDLWVKSSPAINLSSAGAELIFNPSASYEITGKDEVRRALVYAQAIKNTVGYVYVSCGSSENNEYFTYAAQNIAADMYKVVLDNVSYSAESHISYAELDIDAIKQERSYIKNRESLDSNYKFIKVEF